MDVSDKSDTGDDKGTDLIMKIEERYYTDFLKELMGQEVLI